jgi:hypothetical protein
VELINKRKCPHTGFDSDRRDCSNHGFESQSSLWQPIPGAFLADSYEFGLNTTPTFSICHNPDVPGRADSSTAVPGIVEPIFQAPGVLTKTSAVGEAALGCARQVTSALMAFMNFPGSELSNSQLCTANDVSARPAQMYPRGTRHHSYLNSFLGNGSNAAAVARVNFGEGILSSGRGAKTQSNKNNLNDPRNLNQEIKELLENIQPDVKLQHEEREETPGGLKAPLVSQSLLL